MNCPARQDSVPGRSYTKPPQKCSMVVTKQTNHGGKGGRALAGTLPREGSLKPQQGLQTGHGGAVPPAPLPPLPAGRGPFKAGAAPRPLKALPPPPPRSTLPPPSVPPHRAVPLPPPPCLCSPSRPMSARTPCPTACWATSPSSWPRPPASPRR